MLYSYLYSSTMDTSNVLHTNSTEKIGTVADIDVLNEY